MTSVVIPAHNEATVLARCLAAVLDGRTEVTVVANGCTDDTAQRARALGATVLVVDEASKSRALNVGDAAATGFPRIYLDADVVLSDGALAELAAPLQAGTALATAPRRVLDLAGRPWTIRAYFAVHSLLPASVTGLFGRGAIALSAAGRARFAEFPAMTADDLFLDSLFGPGEREIVATATSTVATPRRLADLLRRLVRVRAANAAMRQHTEGIRPARRWSFLGTVIRQRPTLVPAALWYAALTVTAAVLARRGTKPGQWHRDESSRTDPAATS